MQTLFFFSLLGMVVLLLGVVMLLTWIVTKGIVRRVIVVVVVSILLGKVVQIHKVQDSVNDIFKTSSGTCSSRCCPNVSTIGTDQLRAPRR